VGRRGRRGEHMHALGLLGFERLKRALQGRRGEHMHALGLLGFERLKRALLALCLCPGSQDRRGSLGGHTHP